MRLERVEYMPAEKQPDRLYYSERFALAIHLCPCERCAPPSAAAREAVTPIGAGEWSLTIDGDAATLSPSILNRGCNAHYWIRDGLVVWA